MPWLNQAGAVLDAWYPGQSNGTALANVLFGQGDPSGHLPVTFPASLSEVPASKPAQFPGINGQVLYTEGLDVGYRWYDAKNVTPLFPFGYGLSYTKFGFSHLQVNRSAPTASVTSTCPRHHQRRGDRRGGCRSAVHGDPASAGEPRAAGRLQRVSLPRRPIGEIKFTITPRDTWWWDTDAGGGRRVLACTASTSAIRRRGEPATPRFVQRRLYVAARQVIVHAPRVDRARVRPAPFGSG